MQYARVQHQNYSVRRTGRSSSGPVARRGCPPLAEYFGNVFLLGLTTLAGEVIDLKAADALSVLLAPLQAQDEDSASQEILAGNVADTDVVDLLSGLL